MNGGKYHRQLWFWCFVVFICLSSCFMFLTGCGKRFYARELPLPTWKTIMVCRFSSRWWSIPSKHTASFRHPYNIHNVKTTSYGCQNNVVCVLGWYKIFYQISFYSSCGDGWLGCPLTFLSFYKYSVLVNLKFTKCKHLLVGFNHCLLRY